MFSGERMLANSDRRRLGGGRRRVLVFSGGRMLAKMGPRKAGQMLVFSGGRMLAKMEPMVAKLAV